MKRLRSLVIGFVAVIAIAGIVGFFLPRTVTAARSIIIKAPPSRVFAVSQSLRAFARWSPWTSLDPNMKFSFEGPESGVGQKLTWSSRHRDVGDGSLQITDAVRDQRVGFAIRYDGMTGARSSLDLAPDAAGTKVTWSFDYDVGENPFTHYVALFVPGMVGNTYAKGLANLKAYVEAIPDVDISDLDVSRVFVPQQMLIAVHTTTENSPQSMAMSLANSYLVLTQTLAGTGLAQNGEPISKAEGVKSGKIELEAALPVASVPEGTKLPSGVVTTKSDAGPALRLVHHGSYASLQTSYLQLLAYALTNGWKVRGSTWNEYVTEPAKTAGDNLETDVYLPVE